MMKVYGVTFDHSVNYGSFLQAYALGRAVKKLRIGTEKCDYRLVGIMRMPDRPIPKQTWRTGIHFLMRYTLVRCHYRFGFLPFEKKNGIRYAPVKRYKDLPELNDTADAFMCGSDVIWSDIFSHGYGVYFLDFARKYKFSYAASFGKSNKERIPDENAGMIRELDAVSCREESGCDMVEQITGKRPELVLDPVFLLKKDEWEQIAAQDTRAVPEHYIFAYNTFEDPVFTSFLEKLRKETGLPVVRATWRMDTVRWMLYSRMLTPQRWLKLIARADYVVSNSFHATGFSVLFHRKFFSFVRGPVQYGQNVRIWDLLSRLGLENRIFNAVPDMIDTGSPDYSETDSLMDGMRKKSIDYLYRNLNNAYRQKNASSASEN